MRILATAIILTIPWNGHAQQSATEAPADTLPQTTLAKLPELPRKSIDTALTQLTGRTILVRKGENLQRAIDRAQRGDTIRVDPSGDWPSIVLPEKPGTGWIHIESAALAQLPAAGQRVTPEDATHMPTVLNIVTGTPRPALNTEERASHYRIMGLRFKSRPYEKSGHNKMLMLGRGGSTMITAKSPQDLPHHIIFDRCIVDGWPGNTTRGLYLDGSDVAVIGCQIMNITAAGESHGILITDTPGPILIENNAIGASGINIFIGQNDPLQWKGVNAADITIRGNHLYKKPEWKADQSLKNHFEMKRGVRVLFEENECVYSPLDAQAGYAIKLKTGGHDQWVEDVTIRNNKIRDVGGYIAISNDDPDDTVSRVLSYDNDVQGISLTMGAGVPIQILVEPGGKMVEDITFFRDQFRGSPTKALMSLSGSTPVVARLECREIQAERGMYGIKGDGQQEGTASLRKFCDEFVFLNNTIHGAAELKPYYPPGNNMLAR